MADIELAVGFVVAHADAVERAMLSHLRSGTPPPAPVLAHVEAGQTPEGGWPAGGGAAGSLGVASVDATCFRLAEIEALSGLERPAATRARHWLARRQQIRGGWEEDPALAEEAPPWARPGDPEASFYLTANAAYWLAVAGSAGFEEAVERAAAILLGALDANGAWPGFLSSGWLAAAVLHRVGSFYEAARIMMLLGDRVPTMSPSDAAELIVSLARAGIGPDDALVAAARRQLEATQRPDGGWPSDDKEAFDVRTTLTVLRALR